VALLQTQSIPGAVRYRVAARGNNRRGAIKLKFTYYVAITRGPTDVKNETICSD